jgi:hypothetical protein
MNDFLSLKVPLLESTLDGIVPALDDQVVFLDFSILSISSVHI